MVHRRKRLIDLLPLKVRLSKDKDGAAGDTTIAETSQQPVSPEIESKAERPEAVQPEKPDKTGPPDKARLMSRIAKMGQAMFPLAAQSAETDDVSDNEV